MASGPISQLMYGDPVSLAPLKRPPERTWLVRDIGGERHTITAESIDCTKERLSFSMHGQVIACFNGWSWYRLHSADLAKLDPVNSNA